MPEDLLVGLSFDGLIITSSDGITWTNTATLGAGQTICYGAGLYVAGIFGDFAHSIKTSPDASTWTTQFTDVGGNTNGERGAVCFGGGQYVAIWDNFVLDPFGVASSMTSPDAATWTGHAFHGVDSNTTYGFSVAFGSGVYVTVGDGSFGIGKTTSGSDGISWASLSPSGFDATRVRFIHSLFAATGSSVFSAPDGVTWTTHAIPLDHVNDIAYG